MTHHDPDSGEATTFPHIVFILYVTLPHLHPNGSFSQDSQSGVPKLSRFRLPGLWSPITLREDLKSKCGLKQSCSSRRELSNGMWHVVCSQVNRVDSRLLVVGSQTANLTPGLSFGHNLCFRCPNGSCEPISDIYVLRAFQWYKELFSPMGFDSYNCSMNI